LTTLGKFDAKWQTKSRPSKESMMRKSAMTFVAALLAAATLVSAKDKGSNDKPAPPPLVRDLTACRLVSDNAARLSCFDAAAAKLEAAYQANEIYIADKTQVKATRRKLFGLPIPDLGIFGGGDDAQSADKNEVSEIETTVKAAISTPDGWRIITADESTWQQIDSNVLALSPKPGMKLIIRKAALGSFKMNVAGMPAIKVKRIL
jgi:hypothetical protein